MKQRNFLKQAALRRVTSSCQGGGSGCWSGLRHGVRLSVTCALLLTLLLAARPAFAQADGYREREGGYVSKCDLCLDLRGYLVKRGEYRELAPRAFYERLEDS